MSGIPGERVTVNPVVAVTATHMPLSLWLMLGLFRTTYDSPLDPVTYNACQGLQVRASGAADAGSRGRMIAPRASTRHSISRSGTRTMRGRHLMSASFLLLCSASGTANHIPINAAGTTSSARYLYFP